MKSYAILAATLLAATSQAFISGAPASGITTTTETNGPKATPSTLTSVAVRARNAQPAQPTTTPGPNAKKQSRQDPMVLYILTHKWTENGDSETNTGTSTSTSTTPASSVRTGNAQTTTTPGPDLKMRLLKRDPQLIRPSDINNPEERYIQYTDYTHFTHTENTSTLPYCPMDPECVD